MAKFSTGEEMRPGEYEAFAYDPNEPDAMGRLMSSRGGVKTDYSNRASPMTSQLVQPMSTRPMPARPAAPQMVEGGYTPQMDQAPKQGQPISRPDVDPTKQVPSRAEYNAINPMGRTDLTPDQIRLRRAFTNPNMRNTLSGAQKKAIGAELGFENQEFSRRQVEQSTLDRQKAFADAQQKLADTRAGAVVGAAKERSAATIRAAELRAASSEKIKSMDVDVKTRLAEAKQTGDYKLATDLETQRQEGRIELARREGRDVTTDEFWQKEASDIKEEIAKGEIKKSTDLFDRRAASKQAILNNENMSKDQQNVAIAKLDKAYDEMSQTINAPTAATPSAGAAPSASGEQTVSPEMTKVKRYQAVIEAGKFPNGNPVSPADLTAMESFITEQEQKMKLKQRINKLVEG